MRRPNVKQPWALFSVLCLILALSVSQASAQGAASTSTPTPKPGSTIHVVQRGENLYRIALLYGTTVEEISRANGITNATQISIGQRLLIPNVAPGAALNSSAGAASAPGIPTSYTVGPGDSLPDLAWRYGTTVELIAHQNKIVNPAGLYVGLPLALKEGADGRPLIKTGRIYRVQPGDTLYRIAAVTGQTISAIMRTNDLRRISALYAGQQLVIPAGADGPALTDLPLPFAQFTMQPAQAQQGRTVALEITTAGAMQLSGTFMGHPILDRSDDNGLTHHVLIGVNAFADIGIYPLQLTATDAAGHTTDLTRSIAVSDGGYTSEKIVLPPEQLDLLDPKITQPEIDQIMAIVGKVTSKRYFGGPMGLPVPAAITSQFGTRRSYNSGPYNQFHTGTDFAGPPGSPIYAPAAGVVVFTGPLHVRGNATIIDHGWGVYTGYWHQTQSLVQVGQTVAQGDIIGKIGSTGRVTGPHLHWELFVGGVQVDPTQWARASFP